MWSAASEQKWAQYKTDFAQRLRRALVDGYFANQQQVETFFRELETNGQPAFDETGTLVLRIRDVGQDRIVGITRDNILSLHSDRRLAYKLMLAKINAELKAKGKARVSLETLKGDWELLIRLAETYSD